MVLRMVLHMVLSGERAKEALTSDFPGVSSTENTKKRPFWAPPHARPLLVPGVFW